MTKVVHLQDTLALKEEAPVERLEHRNHIDIFDNNGQFLMRSYNIVVNTGRLLTLSKVFNQNFATKGLNGPNKHVSTFAVGDGGALEESLSSPVSVDLKDRTLYNHLQFRADAHNMTHVDANINAEAYWDNTNYKDIKDIIYTFNNDEDQVMYCEMTLEIAFSECHGKNVNELGLFICDHDETTGKKSNFEMFSHISFASLPNMNTENGGGDSYVIKYRVYA